MSFQSALTPFNANSVDDRESRGLREHYEHSQRYHQSDKENMVSQLSILSTFLKKSPVPEAPTQAQQALDFAIHILSSPQSLTLPSTIEFNHQFPSSSSSLPIQASAADDHQLLPSSISTVPTSTKYNIQINCQTTLDILYHHSVNTLPKPVRVDILAISLSWTLMPGLTHI